MNAVSGLEILSAAPWFDDAAASELLARSSAEGDADRLLAAIKQSGALVERAGLWRIPEPLRSDMRRRLYAQDRSAYTDAVGVFVSHAQNGMGSQLNAVMGPHGAAVNTEVLAFLVGEVRGDSNSALQRLVAVVREDDEKYESEIAADISRLLTIYGVGWNRTAAFFMGLSMWARGSRLEALGHFEAVLDDPRRDIAAAIAAHLIGVALYGDDLLDDAKERVEQSVSIGRDIGDDKGLVLTLSTLGRVELALHNRSRDAGALERAMSALSEAADLTEDGEIRGRTLQYLAEVHLRSGDIDSARRVGYEAIDMALRGERAVEARAAVALIEREAGNDPQYLALLDDALEIARRDQVGGRSLAKLLNMEASSRRRSGDLPAALALAKRSLALGRRIKDRRHVAHAAHTLAAIRIDLVSSAPDIDSEREEVRKLLEESRRTLVRLKDASGVELVDRTIRRFEETAPLHE